MGDVVDNQVRSLASEHPEPWAYLTEAYVYEAVGGGR